MPTLKIQDTKILDSQYSIEKKNCSRSIFSNKNALKIPSLWSWNIPTPSSFPRYFCAFVEAFSKRLGLAVAGPSMRGWEFFTHFFWWKTTKNSWGIRWRMIELYLFSFSSLWTDWKGKMWFWTRTYRRELCEPMWKHLSNQVRLTFVSNRILVKDRQVTNGLQSKVIWHDSSFQHIPPQFNRNPHLFYDREKPFVQFKSFVYSKVYCTKLY